MRPHYAYYARQLQLLAWRDRRARWALKSPAHLFWVDELVEALPDVALVQLHRDPAEVIGSFSSLVAVMAATNSATVDLAAIGRTWARHWADGVARAERSRARTSAGRIHDVRYTDLVATPVDVVAEIYRTYGFASPTRSSVGCARTSTATRSTAAAGTCTRRRCSGSTPPSRRPGSRRRAVDAGASTLRRERLHEGRASMRRLLGTGRGGDETYLGGIIAGLAARRGSGDSFPHAAAARPARPRRSSGPTRRSRSSAYPAGQVPWHFAATLPAAVRAVRGRSPPVGDARAARRAGPARRDGHRSVVRAPAAGLPSRDRGSTAHAGARARTAEPEVVLVCSEYTAADVIATYRVAPEKVHVVPPEIAPGVRLEPGAAAAADRELRRRRPRAVRPLPRQPAPAEERPEADPELPRRATPRTVARRAPARRRRGAVVARRRRGAGRRRQRRRRAASAA